MLLKNLQHILLHAIGVASISFMLVPKAMAVAPIVCDSCSLVATEVVNSQNRPTERQWIWGVGAASLLDTYLSPLTYKGMDLAWLNRTERQARWGRGNVTVLGLYNAHFAYAKSPTDDGKYMDAELTVAGGWHYNWFMSHHTDNAAISPFVPTFLNDWRVAVGGLVETSGGFTYNTRNGNNPAQGRLGVSLMASAIVERNFWFFKQRAKARVQLDAQMVGVQFSPVYGQSYYEIFSLGHNQGVVHFTHLGNCPSARILTMVTLPIKKSQVSLGYLGDVRQSKLGGLKRHAWRNMFMVGYTRNITRL